VAGALGLDVDPEEPDVPPCDEAELLASEGFLDSGLAVGGEVAEDLPRLSVR